MISAGEFRKGVTFEYESGIYTIVDFQHVKPGKGSAFVRTKMKNVITGAVLEKTWNPTEKVQEAHIETKNMTYSYNDGELYYFMDQDFELTPLNHEQVEDALRYIKENDNVVVKFYKGAAFSVECDNFVTLRVVQADPSVHVGLSRHLRLADYVCHLKVLSLCQPATGEGICIGSGQVTHSGVIPRCGIEPSGGGPRACAPHA